VKITGRRSYVDRRIFATLLALAIFSLATTILIVATISAMVSARQSGVALNNLRNQVSLLSTELVSAESSQRGYILTSNQAYLAPYDDATKAIPAQLHSLNLAATGTPYASGAQELQKITEAKLGELAATLGAYTAGGIDAGIAAVNTDQGATLMTEHRRTSMTLEARLGTGLEATRIAVNHYANLARIVGLLTVLGTIILVVGVYLLFEHALEAERALDRAKDEFVSLASHQLRTPATGIKSILSMLAAGDFGALTETQQSVVGKAVSSNERELAIIEELLNVAKADAGRLVLKVGNLELMTLIDSIMGEQHEAFRAKDLKVKVKRPAEPIEMLADEEKLYMALSNLIDNARKYTPQQGKITVSVTTHRANVMIEVADTGIGIEEAELAHIFDRFQRARMVLAGTIEGTGLGLYLARRIAELHHGTIDVTSKRGHGSRFIMILPRHSQL
jgi:signal transduction histidine kinase